MFPFYPSQRGGHERRIERTKLRKRRRGPEVGIDAAELYQRESPISRILSHIREAKLLLHIGLMILLQVVIFETVPTSTNFADQRRTESMGVTHARRVV